MTNTPSAELGVSKSKGRPVGSKNKPKIVRLTETQMKLAKKLGLEPERFAQELAKSKQPRKKKIDWEKLARQLQGALESQITDNAVLDAKITSQEKRYADLDQEFKMAKLHYVNLEKSHKHISTILSYLEAKIGLDSIRRN
jgi:hypothetical protein